MHLELYKEKIIPQIEAGLNQFLSIQHFRSAQALKHMISYHLGWEDSGKHGKRLRPLMTLLCTGAFDGDLNAALPAALSVEYLHNFTLIHDDIEDRSEFRHGRETVWKRWGIAQAINAGDALFCIAQLAMLELSGTCGDDVAAQATAALNQVCFHLTQGQYLDIAFESADQINLETYLSMIEGKTAALISFSTALGGIVTRQDKGILTSLSTFGKQLGMAFQIQDDFLGIWGNQEEIGKSTSIDLQTKKKTLPVLYGLKHSEQFNELWSLNNPSLEQISLMADLLDSCGAKDYINKHVADYTNQAFDALDASFDHTKNDRTYIDALLELGGKLINRTC